MTADLLRDTLREVLYGPDGFSGLFSAPGELGLLRTVHALDLAAVQAQPALARRVLALRQHLELAAAHLADPYALLQDDADPQTWFPADPAAWRAELVALARAGQALYDALYLPLKGEALRDAHGAVLRAAREAAVLAAWPVSR
ncbi:hypothetical protein [Deinococcus multiflagellatus]|uniref:Uncharacterized protein n=1 Tax=Deinococcus multiflagellatus TaxID=1656887 RepID=A0ABW1ZMI7_9DEIO|nr:hypothetical protein [Deinococcus multiflagellatus]MBZ9713984.1 hypothetical protein [Deinococcus multiflagellatus]